MAVDRLPIGARTVLSTGYVYLKVGPGRARFEHIVVAEKALGHTLPIDAQVHHVDDNGQDNAGTNLVICQDHAYHKGLHRRRRVLRAGGDPWLDKWCCTCQRPRPLSEFSTCKHSRPPGECRACANGRRRIA